MHSTFNTIIGIERTNIVLAQDINLPDMGSPADAVLSKTDEAQIGRSIMQQIRASGTIIDDPQINEYINEIGYRVAAHANESERTIYVLCYR